MSDGRAFKSRTIFMVGGTGLSRLCHYFLTRAGHRVHVLFDRAPNINPDFGCEVFHDRDLIKAKAEECDAFIACVGGRYGSDRAEYSDMLSSLGLVPMDVIYQSSTISETARVGRGLQAMAGSVVSEFVTIGDWCLINTNSSIDHGCQLGNGVHIMPGATLTGEITVEDYATIGTNATVLPRIRIGRGAFVGAGAVVTRDVAANEVVVGNPARTHER